MTPRSCPFCESRSLTSWHLGYLPPETPWVVECNKCFARGPTASTDEEAWDAWGYEKEVKE